MHRVQIVCTLAATALAQEFDAPPPATVNGQKYVPRPYEPPALEPEPEATPIGATFEVTDDEVLVHARPWYPTVSVGALAKGSRVAATGRVASVNRRFCGGNVWYRLAPGAWVCSMGLRETREPPDAEPLLRAREGSALPFSYVMVVVDEGATIPMWASPSDAAQGKPPERQLGRGDTVAVQDKPLRLPSGDYWLSTDEKVLPQEGTARLKDKSAWQGAAIDAATRVPFGWALGAATVWDRAEAPRRKVGALTPRERVDVLEEAGEGGRRMLRIGDGRWVFASQVNEVRVEPRPKTARAPQWIDVDAGEQVLVAYEGERPVYATLTSSGAAIPTPRGDYPMWAKAQTITMKSQPYEDKAYFVHNVPWVLFFQAHNAIHGAYWHDRFGRSKSHGCVNVSPRDARWLFEWVQPALPPGWSGIRPVDLREWPLVHVRDSRLRKPWLQERPIGPPDKELEKLKLAEAEARRAAAQAAVPAAAAPAAPGALPSLQP